MAKTSITTKTNAPPSTASSQILAADFNAVVNAIQNATATVDTEALMVNGTSVITNARVLQNVTAANPSTSTQVANKAYVDTQDATKENTLGNPASDGYVLSSTTGGTRSWIAPSAGGSGDDYYPTFDYYIYKDGADTVGVRTDTQAEVSRNTDAHTVFQAVVDHLEANLDNRGWIHVKRGTYVFTDTWDINCRLKLTGDGQEATILQAGNSLNKTMITINGVFGTTLWRCSFLDLKFNGNKANQSSNVSIMKAHGIIQSRFHRCHFENAKLWCLELRPAGGDTAGDYGHHNQIIDCLFDQSGTSGAGGGLFMKANDENYIGASQFQYTEIGIHDDTGFNQIEGCSFVNWGTGVYLTDCSRTRIINSVFDLNRKHGIHIKGAFNTVEACTFYGIGADSAGTYSHIYIDYYGCNSISGCKFLNNNAGRARSGVREAGNAANNTYGNNIITGNHFIRMHNTNATQLDAANTWGTAAIEQANTNTVANNLEL